MHGDLLARRSGFGFKGGRMTPSFRRGWIKRLSAMVFGVQILALGIPARVPAQSTASPPAAETGARTAREAALEERLHRMEALLNRMPDPEHVRQLESTVQKLSSQVD